MMGIVSEGYIGRPARELLGEDAMSGIDPSEWLTLPHGIETVHRDFEWSDVSGRHSWLHLSLARDPNGTRGRVIGILEDITERHAITDRLAHMAVHDSLTGLPNRVAFRTSLNEALDRPTAARWRWPSWTSTGSRSSTTPSVTPWVTACSRRWPAVSPGPSRAPASSLASPATSSPCWWSIAAGSRCPRSSPGCRPSWPNRCSWPRGHHLSDGLGGRRLLVARGGRR